MASPLDLGADASCTDFLRPLDSTSRRSVPSVIGVVHSSPLSPGVVVHLILEDFTVVELLDRRTNRQPSQGLSRETGTGYFEPALVARCSCWVITFNQLALKSSSCVEVKPVPGSKIHQEFSIGLFIKIRSPQAASSYARKPFQLSGSAAILHPLADDEGSQALIVAHRRLSFI